MRIELEGEAKEGKVNDVEKISRFESF